MNKFCPTLRRPLSNLFSAQQQSHEVDLHLSFHFHSSTRQLQAKKTSSYHDQNEIEDDLFTSEFKKIIFGSKTVAQNCSNATAAIFFRSQEEEDGRMKYE